MEQKYRIGNDYGHITWDVGRMLRDRANFEIKEFSVAELAANNRFYGDTEYAMTTDSTVPLIVVSLKKGTDKLIDGNHRLYKAKGSGVKTIFAYYLSVREHCRYIIEYDEMVYRDVVEHWNV